MDNRSRALTAQRKSTDLQSADMEMEQVALNQG